MSQSGLIDIESSHPQIPTSFTADVGSAIPIDNTLQILGSEGLQTLGAGGTITVTGEDATAGATALLATKGIASFNSSHFTVASGFVSLSGGIGMETFLTDDGAPAVEPNGDGLVEIVGGIGVTTEGQGPGNTVTLNTNLTSAGSTVIITNSTGSINLEAGAVVPTTFTTDAGNATPAASILNVLGGNNLSSAGAGNTVTLNLTGTTDHCVQVGNATGSLTSIGVGGTGELLVGAAGADPAFGTSANGDFTFTSSTAGATRTLTITNADNTAAASSAALNITVGGTTSTGDPYVNWLVTGGGTFSMGIDNSDNDNWKLTTGATPSAGTELLEIESDATDANFNIQAILQSFDTSGAGNVTYTISNLDNTAAASNAALNLSVGGTTSTGDPYINWLITGSTTYSMGIDNSVAGDVFKLTNGANLGAGTTYMLLDIPASRWEFPINIILQEISNDGGGVQNYIKNTSDTADSEAFFKAEVGGTSGGDAYINFDVSGGSEFSVGIDNSDDDAFKIGPNTNPSTGNSDFEIAAATGAITFNEAYTFPVADGNANDVLTTDGSGAVTWVANSSAGVVWSAVTANTDLTGDTGTIANKAGLLTMTLPATGVLGEIIRITGINTAVGWRIAQNANQQIHMGTSSTTAGVAGYLEATNIRDSVELVCVVAGGSSEYNVISSIGNITVA